MSRPSAPFTWPGFLEGARRTLPLWPGLVVFATVYGAAAAQKGLSALEAVAASAFVYAGASQMVALEVWPKTWSITGILGVAFVTAVVNARYVLMGASLEPWIKHAAPLPRAAIPAVMVDASWMVGTAYRREGGNDVGVLLGASLSLWPPWVLATALGYTAGALVPDPRPYGLDLVMPIFFAVMLAPLWRGLRPALPWAVAGIVALIVQRLAPGYLFIVAGALAGTLAGAFLGGPDDGGQRGAPRGSA
jgi:predicted branched-subunit amino acid permease